MEPALGSGRVPKHQLVKTGESFCLGGCVGPWPGAEGGPFPCVHRCGVKTSLHSLQILKILSGKIVVGHAIHNDFKALKYFHPKAATRDTSKIPLLNRKAGFPENESASLKRLTKQLLHRDIQVTWAVPGRGPERGLGSAPALRLPRARLGFQGLFQYLSRTVLLR